MSERERFPSGSVLIGLLVLTILGAAVGTPMLLKSRREARIRETYASLRELSAAEADFRANDRDGNKVNDFWTGDVVGLIGAVNPALGRADTRPIRPLSSGAESREGNFLQALDHDNRFRGSPEWIYRMDTDGSGRKVHNVYKFGFCAYPEVVGPGRPIFIINEYNEIFHRMDGKLHFDWPADSELKYNYSRFDY